MLLRLVFLAAVLIVGRPVTAWPQDWQMFATVGVGAQLVCSSGDPTRLDYQLEGSLGGLLEFTGTGLAAGGRAFAPPIYCSLAVSI